MNSERTSPDLRVRRTRKLLLNALLDLLMEKEWDAITVTSVCERAMVHRTTFYSHFRDKYDLLCQGMHEAFDQLLAEGPPLEQTTEQDSWNNSPVYFVGIFKRAATDPAFYRRMLCNPGVPAFRAFLHDYLVDRTREFLTCAVRTTKPDIPLSLAVHFGTGAVVETLAWWLDNGCPYSADEMELFITHLLNCGTHCAPDSGDVDVGTKAETGSGT